jgi:hypothetical protein
MLVATDFALHGRSWPCAATPDEPTWPVNINV